MATDDRALEHGCEWRFDTQYNGYLAATEFSVYIGPVSALDSVMATGRDVQLLLLESRLSSIVRF